MAEIILPYFAQSAGETIVIAGVTYRVGRVDPDGRLLIADEVDSDDIRVANENYSAAQTNNELIAAPGAALRIYIVEIIYSTDAANNFKLTQSSGSPADVFGPHYFPANGGMAPGRLGAPIALNLNSALRITSVGAANHSITVIAKVAA